MAVLDIIHYGNPILRKKCNPVKEFDGLNDIINDLFDSMYEKDGIGLAANQVGLDMNLFIIDITHTEETNDVNIFINSKIISKNGNQKLYQEGCLSLPEIALDVTRPEYVKIKYQTLDKKWHENEFGGLMSRAIQHEIDHLNGIFVIDRISPSERIKYQNQLKTLETNSKNLMKLKTEQKGFLL